MIEFLAAHWTEILGFGTGLVCVFLASRRNVWNFPIGIANNIVFIALFFGHKLYAEVGLQVVFLVLGVMGWLNWVRAQHREDSAGEDFVRVAPARHVALAVLVGIGATALLVWLLGHTDSTTPIPDAAITAFSLVAQFMLNMRWLQSWWVWIAVDVVSVALYAYKGLWITAALYLVFIGLCVSGLLGWTKHHRAMQQAEHASV